MTLKVGRNDECPCGSGKKFKKCCMQNPQIIVSDHDWQKIRVAEGKLIEAVLLPYITSIAPKIGLYAWDDFWFGKKDWPEYLYEGVRNQLFFPWLFFNWKPIDLEEIGIVEIEEGFSIALQFLQKKGHLLTEYEKKFITQICKTHYSFYVVQEAVPGKSLTLKDIFLKTTITVKELQGSQTLKPGDILFTRILSMDNQSICVGMFPLTIPSKFHTELIDIREALIEENGSLTRDKLAGELEESVREILFELLEDILNPVLPQLCNTDGDPIVFCTLSFALNASIEDAVDALLPMTLSKDREEFLNDAKRNKKTGAIVRVELPWIKKGNKKNKHWDNTLLGNMVIEVNKITVDVNSENRARKAEKEIIRRLKDNAQLLNIKKQSAEKAMIAERKKEKPKKTSREEIPLAEKNAIIEAHLKQHYIQWLDDSLPILNGLTPREAAKTEDGRERLEAVLLSFERHSMATSKADDEPKVDVTWLRKELGIN